MNKFIWPDFENFTSYKNETEISDKKSYEKTTINPKQMLLNELKNKYVHLAENDFIFDQEFSKDFQGYSKNLVFSKGNIDAKIVVVGEAPGAEEDKLLQPFVGQSGKLLMYFLKQAGYTLQNLYFTNVVPFRPPSNRTPLTSEIMKMKYLLHEHIKIIDPILILCAGSIAAKAFEIPTGISQASGNLFNTTFGKVFCVYHPAYILRAQNKKKEFWKSFLKMDQMFSALVL